MIIDKTIKVGKETDDVMTLVVEVIKAVRGKQAYQECLDEMIKAIDGANEIGTELENKQVFMNTVGARSGDMFDAFQEPIKE